MEKITSLLQKISKLPKIGKFLSLIVIIVALVVYLFFNTSCSAPRASVRVLNRADSTETTISVHNGDGGSTSVHISPKLNYNVDTTNVS